MKTEGSLAERGLPEVLPVLGQERRTGILTIQGHQEIIAFALLDGGIVSADALNQTMEEGLGLVLGDLGLVSAEQFAGLAAEYQAGGGQVVDLLVERGFVEREQLLEAVRTHTYRLCRQALRWTEGDYKFYQGEEVSYEEGVEPISAEELLARSSRDLDEELLPGGVPSDDVVYKRTKGGKAPEEDPNPGGFAAVDQQAISMFKLITDKRSVAELAEASGMRSYRVAYFLSQWQEAGMVERVRVRRSSSSAEPEASGGKDAARAAPAERRHRPSVLANWWAGRRATGKNTGKAVGKTAGKVEELPWPSRVLGLLFVAVLIAYFAGAPSQILLPFPWQRGLQESLDRERSSAALTRLRLANSAHFLLHGRFAEDLSDLAESRLLSTVDLTTGGGLPLLYSANEASYVVGSFSKGSGVQETYLQETVRGNFLLDPELEPPAQNRRPPLVLLD